MSPFHFYRLLKTLVHSSFYPLPWLPILQLFLGLPLFLFPWGFRRRTAFDISPYSFVNVWPIHPNFLFLISTFISSCPVNFHRSLLEIIFGHHILYIYLRHLFTKVCYFTLNFLCDKPTFTSIQKYGFHGDINLQHFIYRKYSMFRCICESWCRCIENFLFLRGTFSDTSNIYRFKLS